MLGAAIVVTALTRSVSFLQRSNYSLAIHCGEAALPPPLGEVPTEFEDSVGGEGCFTAFALSVTPYGVPALPEGEPRVRNDKFQFDFTTYKEHPVLLKHRVIWMDEGYSISTISSFSSLRRIR